MSATNREPVGVRTVPSGDAIRSADEAQRLTAQGRCPFCKASVPDGEQCPCWNKEAE